MSIIELTEISHKCEQPEAIKIPMKPHQLTILKKSSDIEKGVIDYETTKQNVSLNTKIGVLCDNVGAGKSLQILAIIANTKKCKSKPIDNHYSLGSYISVKATDKIDPVEEVVLPVNVIVVPHTIIKQWIKYIEDYTTLTYGQISNKKTMTDFKENIDKYSHNDILLIASTKYRDFENFWNHMSWTNPTKYKPVSRLIFDEADAIKIVRIREIPASFYWFMTSSYMALNSPYGTVKWSNISGEMDAYYNYDTGFTNRVTISGITNTGFIKDTFMGLTKASYRDDIIKNIFLKNDNDFVTKSFSLISPEIFEIICANPRVYNILTNIVNRDMIEMINAGNVAGAMEQMNCYKVEHTNLIETVTKDLDIELNNKVIEYQMKSKMTYSSKAAKEQSLTKISQDISTIQNKIQMLTDRIKEHDLCSVCFDDIENKTILNCCHSAHCFGCISTWLATKTICPLCRAPVTKDNIIIVSDDIKSNKLEEKVKLDTKMNKLKEIILKRREEEPNFKFLVFTEHENVFRELTTFIRTNNFKYGELKGSISSVNKQIELFKSPSSNSESTDCLLLNANFCGNGINLENATDVFIYHSMSKEKTNQVIGRAQRPGRVGQLKVWKMCYENEVA
jgi:hypothetical protein